MNIKEVDIVVLLSPISLILVLASATAPIRSTTLCISGPTGAGAGSYLGGSAVIGFEIGSQKGRGEIPVCLCIEVLLAQNLGCCGAVKLCFRINCGGRDISLYARLAIGKVNLDSYL